MNVETANLLELGAVIDGKYRLDALLGQGGMGKVFRVTHIQLKKTFALKVMLFDVARDADERQNRLARFRREAEVLARISHPNIVMVTDFGAIGEEQLPYIVMEFIEGETLRDRCRESGQVPLDFALEVTRQICAGLHTAHTQGIVHRDLKPENVMLQTLPDGSIMARVLDFGIAKLAPEAGGKSETLTRESPGIGSPGTPKYMAPEQILGQPIDPRTDIFAINLMLYEMLAGALPSVPVILAEPKPISKIRSDIPVALDEIIGRGLSKLPEQRQSSALDLKRELEAFERNLTLEAALRDRTTPPSGVSTTPGFSPVTGMTSPVLPTLQSGPITPSSGIGGVLPIAVGLIAVAAGGWFFYPQISTALGGGASRTSATALSAALTPKLVLLPGGETILGTNRGDKLSVPEFKTTVLPFRVSQTLVTNGQYAEFVKRTKHRAPAAWGGSSPPASDLDKPVTGVSWDDADAYCQWLSKETGLRYRLIKEFEWEYLARQRDRKGVVDLLDAGFLEWTADSLTVYPGGKGFTANPELRIFRGRDDRENPNEGVTFRFPQKPDFTNNRLGFRVASDPKVGGE
ncbi:MAG: bifunctional serine/threonine-protein kinase/formylglycine-generating enzyme family protein [Chloracidobacterium sp.]|uniref:SUMF1/EgtB/PvdO family nonheme iron enzyme n=1 Tax=Chloracidobacterium validum TaxID=2821543 RepID=A0ABX8B8J3_9BACT|nr:bifunctional serine/threonine-protein kinase/formylglycine-generating enzyme family protein [Chloracidobacterium validum]QUW01918.1 SUMF1/EgtB/PvdO family nonheme iron enzyme [Chloracidobacterium validum]